MYEIIKLIFKKIGQTGPTILMFTSFILLWNKKTLIYYYFFGFIINIIINLLLKGLFQQPRPTEGHRLFELALKHGKEHKYMNGIPFNLFGMPSGHVQSVFYSTMFIHYAFKNIKLTLFYLLISIITLYQRVEYKMHTVFQVIVGSIIGCFIGYLTYYISQRELMGKLNRKKDDNSVLN